VQLSPKSSRANAHNSRTNFRARLLLTDFAVP
jgi:hypothetical protein